MNMINLNNLSLEELEEVQEKITALMEAKQDEIRQNKQNIEELFIKGVVRDETNTAYAMADIIDIALQEGLLKIYFRNYGWCELHKIQIHREEDSSITIEIDDCDLY